MRYTLFLLVLISQVAFGRLDLEALSASTGTDQNYSEDSWEEGSSEQPKSIGFFSFDVGLSYFFLMNTTMRDFYRKSYGDVNLLPVVSAAYFFDLHPVAIGLGAKASYMKKTANTYTNRNGTTQGKNTEELIYVPYQIFLDLKYYALDSLLMMDAWVGYEEAYVQNRRPCSSACNSNGKAWISNFGHYWNAYLTFGGSLGFSLKGLAGGRGLTGKGFLEPRNIFVKLFYEHHLNLQLPELIGGRKQSPWDLSQGQAGLTFSFEI